MGITVAEFLILECSCRRWWWCLIVRPVTTAAGRADFACLDGLHTPSVLGGDGLLAEVPDRIGNPRADGIFRFLRNSVAFRVVFGAGAAPAYDAGRVFVNGDRRAGPKR